MLLLTAAHLDDELDTGVIPGELVFVTLIHDADLAEQGVLCPDGCMVSFGGLASGETTSVAAVRDIDITADQLVGQVAESFARMFTADGLPVDDLVLDLARESAEIMMLAGPHFTPGEVVYRLGTRLTSLERPERGIEQLIGTDR